MATKLVLKNVRLSYPNLFKPKAFKDQDPKYSATFIVRKDDPQVDKILAAVITEAKDKFGSKIKDRLPSSYHNPLKDGDDVADEHPELEGCYYIRTSSQSAPTVLDRAKRHLPAEDEKIYAGCYVNASINIAPFDAEVNKGVTAYLNGVQFYMDGERFGGGGDCSDDFEAEEDDDFEAEDL